MTQKMINEKLTVKRFSYLVYFCKFADTNLLIIINEKSNQHNIRGKFVCTFLPIKQLYKTLHIFKGKAYTCYTARFVFLVYQCVFYHSINIMHVVVNVLYVLVLHFFEKQCFRALTTFLHDLTSSRLKYLNYHLNSCGLGSAVGSASVS